MLLHFLVTDQVGRTCPRRKNANNRRSSEWKRPTSGGQRPFRLSASRPAPALKRQAHQAKPKAVPPPAGPSQEEDKSAVVAEAASAASAADQLPRPHESGRSPAGTRFHAKQPGEGPALNGWLKATKSAFKLDGYFRGLITGHLGGGMASPEQPMPGSHGHFRLVGGGLFSVQATSEGEITPDGLYPTRNEAKGRRMFIDAPVRSIVFDRDEIAFANGDKSPRPPVAFRI